MKATLAAGAVAVAAAGLAIQQYTTAQELRQQLQESENRGATLALQVQAQNDANAQMQSNFEQQISRLQENLQSSSRQLVILSESLQETREMLDPDALAAPLTPASSPDTATEPSPAPTPAP